MCPINICTMLDKYNKCVFDLKYCLYYKIFNI